MRSATRRADERATGRMPRAVGGRAAAGGVVRSRAGRNVAGQQVVVQLESLQRDARRKSNGSERCVTSMQVKVSRRKGRLFAPPPWECGLGAGACLQEVELRELRRNLAND